MSTAKRTLIVVIHPYDADASASFFLDETEVNEQTLRSKYGKLLAANGSRSWNGERWLEDVTVGELKSRCRLFCFSWRNKDQSPYPLNKHLPAKTSVQQVVAACMKAGGMHLLKLPHVSAADRERLQQAAVKYCAGLYQDVMTEIKTRIVDFKTRVAESKTRMDESDVGSAVASGLETLLAEIEVINRQNGMLMDTTQPEPTSDTLTHQVPKMIAV